MRPNNSILSGIAVLCAAAVTLGFRAPQEPEAVVETPVAAKTKVTQTETKSIPFKVEYHFDRSLGPGRLVKVRAGKNGTVTKVFDYESVNGKLVNPKLVSKGYEPPVNAIMNMGRHGWTSTRGNYTREKVMSMRATGYSAYENTNRTAMGFRAGFGIVAVDPRVIKLGTKVYVEGYGFAIAGDTGGAIKGNRIDLCFDSYRQAMNFGRKSVRVHILG
ncbi:MAG: 3D domain-containing protein [Fimbriimonadales bacterium]